jgi:hypothetical protein
MKALIPSDYEHGSMMESRLDFWPGWRVGRYLFTRACLTISHPVIYQFVGFAIGLEFRNRSLFAATVRSARGKASCRSTLAILMVRNDSRRRCFEGRG